MCCCTFVPLSLRCGDTIKFTGLGRLPVVGEYVRVDADDGWSRVVAVVQCPEGDHSAEVYAVRCHDYLAEIESFGDTP
jgi:hypothetical protein